jgi:tetratricopeptide (TPR) repeat protein
VLASVARFRMLAAEHEAAIEAGHQALQMATTFGLEETRADALITVGMARFQAGDDAGPGDIEQGLDVALAANELTAAGRAYHNLAVAAAGNVQTLALLTAGEDLRLRLGDREGARFTRADRAAVLFSLGRWDEALPLIEDFIAECDAGRPSYQEAGLRRARAWGRLARGDTDGAIEDIEKALALAREAKDPQVLLETVGVATLLYAKFGRLDEANSIARELLAAHPRAPWWSSSFGIAAHKVGLAASVQDALRDARHETRWRGPVPLAAAEGRFVEASEIATTIGQNVIAAELRVAAAEAFREEGHHGDARTQLEQALAFYRSVGAIRFIREAEALLATIQSESKAPTAEPHV